MRPLDPATKALTDSPELPIAFLMRLDILNDPVFAWSGLGSITFAAAETGDPALDGNTFHGTGTIIEIGRISEGVGGSDMLEISVPGVSLDDPILRQIVRDRRRWQFRRAWVWAMLLDPDTYAIAGKPFRIKTGRMDQMPLVEGKESGIVKVQIEGQQSYGDEPLGTRYSEQKEINPKDTSQDWVHSLANMTAALGQTGALPGGGSLVSSRQARRDGNLLSLQRINKV